MPGAMLAARPASSTDTGALHALLINIYILITPAALVLKTVGTNRGPAVSSATRLASRALEVGCQVALKPLKKNP